jgi:hypothetical protein
MSTNQGQIAAPLYTLYSSHIELKNINIDTATKITDIRKTATRSFLCIAFLERTFLVFFFLVDLHMAGLIAESDMHQHLPRRHLICVIIEVCEI